MKRQHFYIFILVIVEHGKKEGHYHTSMQKAKHNERRKN